MKMEFFDSEQLEEQLQLAHLDNIKVIQNNEKSLTTVLKEIDNSKKLWKLFIILSLCFIAAEIALIRFLK